MTQAETCILHERFIKIEPWAPRVWARMTQAETCILHERFIKIELGARPRRSKLINLASKIHWPISYV